jgi:hypothetical protein
VAQVGGKWTLAPTVLLPTAPALLAALKTLEKQAKGHAHLYAIMDVMVQEHMLTTPVDRVRVAGRPAAEVEVVQRLCRGCAAVVQRLCRGCAEVVQRLCSG